MKTSYQTLSAAIENLREKGYREDFNITSDHLICEARQLQLHPENFEIKEVYRYEGNSSTDDSSIVYGIESKDGTKGILVDAYGVYANALSPEMAKKLRLHKK